MTHSQTHKVCKLMQELAPGESFYLDDKPNLATHYAGKLGVKITTEICLVVENYKNDPITRRITRVTILGTSEVEKKT